MIFLFINWLNVRYICYGDMPYAPHNMIDHALLLCYSICSVPELLTTLNKPNNDPNHQNSLVKASENIGKVFDDADIRLLMDALCKNILTMSVYTTVLMCVGLGRKPSKMRKHLRSNLRNRKERKIWQKLNGA